MMRGEEVQAAGLADVMGVEPAILVLPGTHSKHLFWKEGAYHRMQNFMTGELFALLSSHSILANSVQEGAFDEAEKEAFLEGIEVAQTAGLLGQLLRVRGRDVLEGREKGPNHYFLSGLLIGHEIRELPSTAGKIVLAASEPLHSLYRLALAQQNKSAEILCLNEADLVQAVLRTHRNILRMCF